MSNENLIKRIQASLEAVQAQDISARDFVDSLRGNGRALEAIPYPLIKEMEILAMKLEIADENGGGQQTPELTLTLTAVQEWLSKLPCDI